MLRVNLRAGAARAVPSLRRSIQTFDNVLDSDINITQSGKTILSSGTGGRSSRTGYTATIFGANGLLGTHLVSKIAKHGTITVVPFREELAKRHLKVCGDLGVVNFMEFDLRNVKSIEDSVKHSDIVFNLIGRDYETKNFTYDMVHVEGARRIAEAVKKYNVSRLIHVSSHSADINSSSAFYRSKAKGELAVRELVPDATIVRPGPLFGNSDRFLNSFASSKFLLSANNNQETVRPAYVIDVARALEKIAFDDSTAGKTYELYGKEYTVKQIVQIIRDATFNDIHEVNLPKELYQFIAKLTQFIYWQTTCPDEVERMFINQIVSENVETFASLGIQPETIEDNAVRLVRHHRSYLTMRDNYETDAQRRKEREYVRITK
ncbi:hypothetical protein TRVA0_085S00100 [Trichomonascus vanleenenianus]|uniref:complex I NDUFA9 subunit family protein n=1 Tax=Trichomonascus vanleenenianus TaxID=2268995 RepID=UPI003ECB5007